MASQVQAHSHAYVDTYKNTMEYVFDAFIVFLERKGARFRSKKFIDVILSNKTPIDISQANCNESEPRSYHIEVVGDRYTIYLSKSGHMKLGKLFLEFSAYAFMSPKHNDEMQEYFCQLGEYIEDAPRIKTQLTNDKNLLTDNTSNSSPTIRVMYDTEVIRVNAQRDDCYIAMIKNSEIIESSSTSMKRKDSHDDTTLSSKRLQRDRESLYTEFLSAHKTEFKVLKTKLNLPRTVSSERHRTGLYGELIAFIYIRILHSLSPHLEVTWPNEVKESGKPFDIQVTNTKTNDIVEYIEVKTTQLALNNTFEFTENEWNFAEQQRGKFTILRLSGVDMNDENELNVVCSVVRFNDPVELVSKGILKSLRQLTAFPKKD